jgi:hypothetical protein
LVVGGAGNKLRRTLLTLILTSLKPNTQFVCEFSCTLLKLTQIILEGPEKATRGDKYESIKIPRGNLVYIPNQT